MLNFIKNRILPDRISNQSDDIVPFDGWDENRISAPLIEQLSDSELKELNKMLGWNCFIVDSRGRRFGLPTSNRKRSNPQIIPDYRLKILQDRINLGDKHVLEVGCFEGIHTVGLCQVAKQVTAIDSRISNVVKTIVRTQLLSVNPKVFLFDLEKIKEDNLTQLKCDVLHHIGVLYHLWDPVYQIMLFSKYVQKAVLLDTHFASEEMLNSEYQTPFGKFRYYKYAEKGLSDAFSGMLDHAKWLSLADLQLLLKNAGFTTIELVENRSERNGPRVLLYAEKPS